MLSYSNIWAIKRSCGCADICIWVSVWQCWRGGFAMSENKVKCAILRIILISENSKLEWVRVLSVWNMEVNVWTHRFPRAAPCRPINHTHYSDVKLNMLIVTLLRKMKVFLWRRRAWFKAQGECGVCVFVCVYVICRFVCQGQNPLPSLSSTPHTWIRADTRKKSL